MKTDEEVKQLMESTKVAYLEWFNEELSDEELYSMLEEGLAEVRKKFLASFISNFDGRDTLHALRLLRAKHVVPKALKEPQHDPAPREEPSRKPGRRGRPPAQRREVGNGEAGMSAEVSAETF